jgi:hypothetical protein
VSALVGKKHVLPCVSHALVRANPGTESLVETQVDKQFESQVESQVELQVELHVEYYANWLVDTSLYFCLRPMTNDMNVMN